MKARQRTLFAVRKRARKRKAFRGERRRVPHRRREAFSAQEPTHVTLRLAAGLPSLRRGRTFGVIRECFRRAKVRFGARLVHFSVMGNHMHLILEARDRGALARAMQGLKIRLAKRLNALWKRAGIVFSERYHAHVLRTPTEVRNALCYVRNNARKHGLKLVAALDPFASGAFFDGWLGRREPSVDIADDSPVAAPRSWVVTVGWRKARRPITPTWVPPPECP